MAKILVVTKDIAEFLIYKPVVDLLRTGGHMVTVVAEGLSLGKWIEAGEEVYKGRPDPIYHNAQTGCRYDLEEFLVLDEIKPDSVLTGLGAPINLGERFGIAANKRGIRLGYVEDMWCVHTRSNAVPDFVCTLDPFGRQKIGQYLLYQTRMPRVYTTGSPAWDRLASVQPDKFVSIASALHDLTVLLAGQDESTTPVIDGLVEALDKLTDQGKRVLLIPRLHPKFLAREDLQKVWLSSVNKARCNVLWAGPQVSTVQLMLSADFTVSTYSNALVEAALLGSIPVSWVSNVGLEKMAEALGGLAQFPLVGYGCAAEVNTAEEFLAITSERRDQTHTRCGEELRNDGQNAARVVAAIELELSR